MALKLMNLVDRKCSAAFIRHFFFPEVVILNKAQPNDPGAQVEK